MGKTIELLYSRRQKVFDRLEAERRNAASERRGVLPWKERDETMVSNETLEKIKPPEKKRGKIYLD